MGKLKQRGLGGQDFSGELRFSSLRGHAEGQSGEQTVTIPQLPGVTGTGLTRSSSGLFLEPGVTSLPGKQPAILRPLRHVWDTNTASTSKTWEYQLRHTWPVYTDHSQPRRPGSTLRGLDSFLSIGKEFRTALARSHKAHTMEMVSCPKPSPQIHFKAYPFTIRQEVSGSPPLPCPPSLKGRIQFKLSQASLIQTLQSAAL